MQSDDAIERTVLDILEKVTETNRVRHNADIQLFEEGILDSLGLMRLIVELSTACGVEIAPTEVERERWATPRQIIAHMKIRVGTES